MTQREDPAELAEIAGRVARIAAENSRLVQRFAHHEQRFRRLSRGVLRSQEAERRRISRELHDGVGQALTALKIQLDLLAEANGGSPALDDVRRLAAAALDDVRQLSRLLRPHMLDDVGLLPTLLWFFRGVEKTTPMRIEFVHQGLDRRLDPDAETLAYRIVQEAVTNAIKHSGAPAMQVRARATPSRLFLTVQDRGVGFDPAVVLDAHDGAEGIGLRGMQDRAELCGARLTIYSAPGAGTLIDVEVPLDEAPAGGPS
jgi:signal transduction histidine kinase